MAALIAIDYGFIMVTFREVRSDGDPVIYLPSVRRSGWRSGRICCAR